MWKHLICWGVQSLNTFNKLELLSDTGEVQIKQNRICSDSD